MRTRIGVIVCIFMLAAANVAYGQDVVEVAPPEFTEGYLETIDKVMEIKDDDPGESVRLLEDLMKKGLKPHEEFSMVGWHLPYLYAEQETYDKFLDLWARAQERELFFPFRLGERPFPDFLIDIEDRTRLTELFMNNERLKEKFGPTRDVEYFVKTPAGYSSDQKYPLFIVIHGGWGSHASSFEAWRSPKMQSEYIVAYVQGSVVRSSFWRSFDSDTWVNQIKTAYDQILKKYPVDTSSIIVGGPSAGGARSLLLALDDTIPAIGLVLAFPVKPREMASSKLTTMVERGVSVAIITGENDWGLDGQKEMIGMFEETGVAHRMVINPGKGHEYPRGFGKQIDEALEFIWDGS